MRELSLRLPLFGSLTLVLVIFFIAANLAYPYEVTDMYFSLDSHDDQIQDIDFNEVYNSLDGQGYRLRFANEEGRYKEELEIIPENEPGLVISLIERHTSDFYFRGESTHDVYFLDFGSWNRQEALVKDEMGGLLDKLGLDINVDEIHFGDYDFATIDHELAIYLFFALLAAIILLGASILYKKGMLIDNLYKNPPDALAGFALSYCGLALLLFVAGAMILGGNVNFFSSYCFVGALIMFLLGVFFLRKSSIEITES